MFHLIVIFSQISLSTHLCQFSPSTGMCRQKGLSHPSQHVYPFKGDKCTISTEDEGVTVTGSGEYITKGTERAEYKDYQWGSNNGQLVQRDILRLAYEVSFDNKDIQVSTNDTLVVQTRESNKKEFFSPKYIKP